MVWPAPELVTRTRIDPSIASASVITWMLLMVITPSVRVAWWVIVKERAVVPTAAEPVSRPEAELVLMTGVSAVVPVFRKMSWRAWNATPMLERGRIVTVMVSPALNWPACVSVMVRLPRSEFDEPFGTRGWLTAATTGWFRYARTALVAMVCLTVLALTSASVPTLTCVWVVPGTRVPGTLRRGPLLAPDGRTTPAASEPRSSIVEATVDFDQTCHLTHDVNANGDMDEAGPVNSVPMTEVAAAAPDRSLRSPAVTTAHGARVYVSPVSWQSPNQFCPVTSDASLNCPATDSVSVS